MINFCFDQLNSNFDRKLEILIFRITLYITKLNNYSEKVLVKNFF